MLYNPKWNKPSHAGYIAWLKTKDPHETFDFMDDTGKCAVDQYFTSIGIDQTGQRRVPAEALIWGELNRVTYGCHTFGDILKNLGGRPMTKEQSALDAWQAEYEVYAKDKNIIAEQLLNQADDISVYLLNMAKSREGSKWIRNHATNLKMIEHRFWEAQQLTKGADSELTK